MTMTSPVLQRVDLLCRDVEPLLDDAGRAEVADVRAGLGEPLRLAVVGRVKAGKSTLVNALVGRLVAPTRAGECTRVVTWYRFGGPDRAEVQMRDGTARPLPLPDGRLPEELGVPAEEVLRVVVHLQAGQLRAITLIDTPGLATLTSANESATRAAILGERESSRAAAGEADAVLFVFREAERADEVQFLRDLRGVSGDLVASATNAAGVLSQADLFGSGRTGADDPFDLARAQAGRLARSRAGEVCGVVPVSGLLAETARTGRFTEARARDLAALADLDPVRLRLHDQLGPPEGTSRESLDRLHRLLGTYGVSSGRHHVDRGAGPFVRWLEERSGVAEVERLVRSQLVSRGGLLKASRALARVRAAAAGEHAGQVRSLVETAMLDPVMHPLRVLAALQLLLAQVPSSRLRGELERCVGGSETRTVLGLTPDASPELVTQTARRLAARAQADSSTMLHPAEVEAARVLARAYRLLVEQPVVSG